MSLFHNAILELEIVDDGTSDTAARHTHSLSSCEAVVANVVLLLLLATMVVVVLCMLKKFTMATDNRKMLGGIVDMIVALRTGPVTVQVSI